MADEKKKPLQWMNHPVADKQHIVDLERMAAVNQFVHKLPVDQAEALAWKAFMRDQHIGGAAHHLAGMKGAHASGNMKAAKEHGLKYAEHLKALGHDAIDKPPAEVLSRHLANTEQGHGAYQFKSHSADMLLGEGHEPTK